MLPKKQQDISEKKDLLTCLLCNEKYFVKEARQCYLAKPETAPPAWKEKNKDRIKAFKRKSK